MLSHKDLRGKLTEDQCAFINNRLDALPSLKRGVYDYLVLGRTFREINVNSGTLIPALKKAYEIHVTGGALTFRERFLYTNEFNPCKEIPTCQHQ